MTTTLDTSCSENTMVLSARRGFLHACIFQFRIYTHHDKKNGSSSSCAKRGVCPCAEGLACRTDSKQHNTLIPWSLVHTANKNGNWVGKYRRPDWDGHFPTTTTQSEADGYQVRVTRHDKKNGSSSLPFRTFRTFLN